MNRHVEIMCLLVGSSFLLIKTISFPVEWYSNFAHVCVENEMFYSFELFCEVFEANKIDTRALTSLFYDKFLKVHIIPCLNCN